MPLDVALGPLTARPAAGERRLALRVRVRGGRAPVRVYLYLDGEPVGAWDEAAGVCEFPAPQTLDRPRAVTVRAIDAEGRWGGASTML